MYGKCTWTLVHLTFRQLSQTFSLVLLLTEDIEDVDIWYITIYINIFNRKYLSPLASPQPGSSNLRPPASPTILEHKLRKLLDGDELVIVATRPRDGDEVNLIIIGIMAVLDHPWQHHHIEPCAHQVKVADQGGEEIQAPSLPLEVKRSIFSAENESLWLKRVERLQSVSSPWGEAWLYAFLFLLLSIDWEVG